jgi:hypothetical protein
MLTSSPATTGEAEMNIKGTKGSDTLVGSTDPDTIRGGRGRDVLDGREGGDVLIGGRGADTFLLRDDQGGIDMIADFKPGKDTIILDTEYGWIPIYDEGNGNIYTVSHFTLAYGPVVGHVTPGLLLAQPDDLISI